MTISVPAASEAAGTLRYPAGSLVILTGLPGAGKTTLLRRLYALDGTESRPVVAGGVVVIDSAQSRLRWSTSLGWAPKPVRTAVVFTTHVWRIGRALRGGTAVIAHNRGCGSAVLHGFAWLARRSAVPFHLLLLDAPPADALAGQQARGRVVARRTFALHHRRWEALLGRVRAGRTSPATGAHVLDRPTADLLEGIHFDGPVPH
ncbi:AAA family ATPase [Nonomuraea aurantiaca]|uniref:AAA family ATPase n=1 Tax=Nonomuraea aurantiaca TaxID=2878562 RepID=UPI001CD95BA8|nr:AAA family ATPase [Nonomuraea aurantiaca]MCA2226417.1 ATP-binding protein [Nonomuraea aurantiaca]